MKKLSISTRLHGATSQKTVIFREDCVPNWKLNGEQEKLVLLQATSQTEWDKEMAVFRAN
jgi:hypothetical protein